MAIINARMRQKRGPIAQLDKDKLLPGEFAIPEDSDKIYICIKTGVILEIPSTQSIQGVIDTLNAVVTQGTQMIDDFRQLEIDKVGIDDNNVSTMTTYSSEKITKLINEADSAENTVTFESNDSEENATWTDVPVLSSTEKHKSIFSKISTMFKNVRYLYKILGTTDISSIEDGTLTGAVAKLNSNINTIESNSYIHGITSTTSILELSKVQKEDTIQSYFIASYTLLTDYPASLINDQGTVYPLITIERPHGIGYIRITAVTSGGIPKQITGYTSENFIIWGNVL